jgi:drug/metabolite transporter (DMT)-like permease
VNYSLSKLTASASAVFANLVTTVSIIAGVLILGENFTVHSFIGSVLIITGVYGTIKNEKN